MCDEFDEILFNDIYWEIFIDKVDIDCLYLLLWLLMDFLDEEFWEMILCVWVLDNFGEGKWFVWVLLYFFFCWCLFIWIFWWWRILLKVRWLMLVDLVLRVWWYWLLMKSNVNGFWFLCERMDCLWLKVCVKWIIVFVWDWWVWLMNGWVVLLLVGMIWWLRFVLLWEMNWRCSVW